MKSAHSRLFEQLLADRRQQLLEGLAMGHAIENYWLNCGKVQGLDEALRLSDDADYRLSGEKPDVDR